MSTAAADMAGLGALAGLGPELAAAFASVSGDIALVIGDDGVIRHAALNGLPLSRGLDQWVGHAFAETVTQECRGKVRQLLQEAASAGVSRRREINLPAAEGPDIPVAVAAIRLGEDGPVLAVGRDLREISAIQRRFVEVQQELERDYWKQRQAGSRYRMLFQVATDAVMVVDAQSLTIVEANRAAAELFGFSPEALVGQKVTEAVEASSHAAVDALLAATRANERPAEIRARLPARPDGAAALVDVSATPFRFGQDGSGQLLLLLRARAAEARGAAASQRLADFVEQMPDAVVITDAGGRLQIANPAFLALCPPGTTDVDIMGRSLAQILGDPGQRLAELVLEVRRNGIASQFRAAVGGPVAGRGSPLAAVLELDITAALLTEGNQRCIGFTLRRQAGRLDSPLQPVDGLAAAIENLAEQLGRVPLPELMQEATHLAERHLIRSALQRARGHTAQAAEWLGISVESLALRMNRHGIDPGADTPARLN